VTVTPEAAALLEILKLVVPFLSGGLAVFLTELYFRKRGRLQKIPLIERVNRLVNPNLQGGITLARRISEPSLVRLVELNKLREYQLTLRNTSTIQLQNVEIQFEFPALDVQEYASPRTTLSKTGLIKVAAVPTDPYPTAFRWRIPHLPSGDSVEFTFQAVDPWSEDYEVALYNSERVIVEKVYGEPASTAGTKTTPIVQLLVLMTAVGALFASMGLLVSRQLLRGDTTDTLTAVKEAGCDLQIVSGYDHYTQDSVVRMIRHRIFNVGQSCVIQSAQFDPNGPLTIKAGDTVTRERVSPSRPKLGDIEVSVNAANAAPQKAVVKLYVAP
jgi:hypothetical protein